MNAVKDCAVKNCIPTPSSCVDWDGGEIDFLDLCNGTGINNVIWELITKVKALEGDNLSEFDIDTLLGICNQPAPAQVDLLAILNVIKVNEVCLSDKIDNLTDIVNGLTTSNAVSVNLKCLGTTDNLGNTLSVNRESFDQLLVDNICVIKDDILGLNGAVTNLQSQVNNLDLNQTVDELSFATCINAAVLPTSTQVINTSQALCDIIDALGDETDIATALSRTPSDWNAKYGLTLGWNVSASNLAESYNNALLVIASLEADVAAIKSTCCSFTCADVKIGFSATYNEDNTALILKFTSGAGTSIPAGFEDLGSEITITDVDDAVETFTTADPDLIANNAEIEIPLGSLNLNGELVVNINTNISNGSLTCSKCINKTVKKSACGYCEICAEGSDEDATIIIMYESSSQASTISHPVPETTSTTTTTTSGL